MPRTIYQASDESEEEWRVTKEQFENYFKLNFQQQNRLRSAVSANPKDETVAAPVLMQRDFVDDEFT